MLNANLTKSKYSSKTKCLIKMLYYNWHPIVLADVGPNIEQI